jgi:hypothetical protein
MADHFQGITTTGYLLHGKCRKDISVSKALLELGFLF